MLPTAISPAVIEFGTTSKIMFLLISLKNATKRANYHSRVCTKKHESFFDVWPGQKERVCFSLGNLSSRQKITQTEVRPLLLCPTYFNKAVLKPRFWLLHNS